MSPVTITNSNQSIIVKSTIFKNNCNDKHTYLIVNDIYKLAKLAEKYHFYNMIYAPFDSSIAECISNNNISVINKLPEKLVTFIKETIEVFRNIEIEEKFKHKKNLLVNFENTQCFSLVSKNLLLETNPLKIFIPFTGMRHLAKSGENYIKDMIKDIEFVTYDYYYSVNLVWPITTYDIEADEHTKKAYQILGLTCPII